VKFRLARNEAQEKEAAWYNRYLQRKADFGVPAFEAAELANSKERNLAKIEALQ